MKFIPQYFIVYKSVTLNVGLLVFLLIWERQPSYYLVFIVLFVLGWNEGIWNSVPPSKSIMWLGYHEEYIDSRFVLNVQNIVCNNSYIQVCYAFF